MRRSYPLVSVELVEYDADSDPTAFRLLFPTYVMTLHAGTASEAQDWVTKIRTGQPVEQPLHDFVHIISHIFTTA